MRVLQSGLGDPKYRPCPLLIQASQYRPGGYRQSRPVHDLEQTLNMGSNSSRWSTSFAMSPAFLGLAFFLTGKFISMMAASAWDTTFHAIHPAYFWGQSHGALEKTNSHHYEQQGHYTGEVRIGTERYKIDGVGVHDHAWGWGCPRGYPPLDLRLRPILQQVGRQHFSGYAG